jgi:hypothetical protein
VTALRVVKNIIGNPSVNSVTIITILFEVNWGLRGDGFLGDSELRLAILLVVRFDHGDVLDGVVAAVQAQQQAAIGEGARAGQYPLKR